MAEEKKEAKVKAEKSKETKSPKSPAKKKRKIKASVPEGKVFILASYNNTIISITNLGGDVIAWSSAGSSGFKGTRKSTPYAAQIAAENAIEKALVSGLQEVTVYVKGVGSGREQAVRGIHTKGVNIKAIIDTTPIPHNGCRKKKQKRN